MSSNSTDKLPSTFNRLAWSNLAAQSAEQVALAAAPIVAVLALDAGAGETGLLQTAQTLPFLLMSIPAGVLADRMSRARLMAGAEALRVVSLVGGAGAGGGGCAELAAARDPRLRRRMRHGRLQRRRAGIGAIARPPRAVAAGERPDRARPYHRIRRRARARRRAGRLDRRRAGLRIGRGAVGRRGDPARRHRRAAASEDNCATPAARSSRRRGVRVRASAAATDLRHAIHLQHGAVRDPGGLRALRRSHACNCRRPASA